MAEHWTVNSDHSETAYIASIKALRAEHGYLTFNAPRIGKDRSLTQNGLFHVWLTECAAHYLTKHKKAVTKADLAGMKRAVKRRFNAANSNNFMVHAVRDPISNDEKRDYTSSGDWKRGEMYMVLEWLQLFAANDGLILESIGQFDKFKREASN